ncbi:MAG: helix-turn-helix transcriptional regulator [Propionibacteriaceae bacterium]|nr:helix-turn-helix transcriptional regulator [Propionibacteriaceae bacterium]
MSTQIARADPDAPIFVIAIAAQLSGMHPQTLRSYDRLGLVIPRRAQGQGRGRRYSPRDIAKLRRIQQLSQDEGVNLEGIRRILELEAQLAVMTTQLAELTELVAGMRASAPGSRVFTATRGGDVHLGRVRRFSSHRAITAK